MGTRQAKLQTQENYANRGKIVSSVLFHQSTTVLYEFANLFSTFGLARNDLF